MDGRRVKLQDGRWLGYAEYGPSLGLPLFFLPGMPGSRLLASHAAAAAEELGFRVMALDRPGIGLSDRNPGRTIRDTANDVAALADLLEIDRFFVMGVSAGGPHAVACAWAMPDRVRRLALVSSVAPPVGVSRPSEGTGASHFLRRAVERTGHAEGQRPPRGSVLREIEHASPPSDRRILARPEVREQLLAAGDDAFRHGTQGVAEEGRLSAAPWGFDPAEVNVEVQLWHGEEDPTVPVEAARALAARLPRCHATFLPGAGHLWHFERLGEVLYALGDGAP